MMSKHDPDLPVYISKRRAATLLDCSLFTVEALIKSGRLPAYRLGERSVRLNVVDVERLLTPLQVSQDAGRVVAG